MGIEDGDEPKYCDETQGEIEVEEEKYGHCDCEVTFKDEVEVVGESVNVFQVDVFEVIELTIWNFVSLFGVEAESFGN